MANKRYLQQQLWTLLNIAGRCMYVILIMAAYWVTEAIPIAVTALLPIVLMPWLGIVGAKQICTNYLKDTNMLFVGGLIVAVAVERWDLHKRIALRVLLIVGSQPKWLLFGFMISTAFLSMWISNTATTAMMVPIAQAVLLELEAHVRSADYTPEGTVQETEGEEMALCNGGAGPAHHKDNQDCHVAMDETTNFSDTKALQEMKATSNVSNGDVPSHAYRGAKTKTTARNREEAEARFHNLAKGMLLCLACSANIGGMATLTGTGPNLVFKGQADTLFGSDAGVNFSSWFIYSFPNMVICLLLAWLWMVYLYVGWREIIPFTKKINNDDTAAGVIRNEYEKLGPMSFAEKAVLVHFIVLAVLWLTREPGFVPGWSYFLEKGFVTDACVAITVSVALFICPSKRPTFLCCQAKDDTSPPSPVPALLDWTTVQGNLSWGVIIVLGGGFALADSCKTSGLSAVIAEFFLRFEGLPEWLIVVALTTITSVVTTVTSNVATATIFLPILAELASSLHVNPLYLMIPVTLAASFAFMLPVATPPNAIVFAYGRLKIIDMVKSGFLLNVICIVVLQLSINTWGYSFFKLGEYPAWADSNGQNTTQDLLGIMNTTAASI